MGELTMNAGVFNLSKESEDNTIALNFRHPQGVDTDATKADLENSKVLRRLVSQNMVMCHTMYQLMILWWRLFFQSMRNKQALKVANKLLVVEHLTSPQTWCALWSLRSWLYNTMHQANEFTEVEDLYRAAAIYAEAIYELINKKERQFVSFEEEKIWKHLKN